MDDAAVSPEASRRYSLGARNESLRTLLLTNPVLSKAAIRVNGSRKLTPSEILSSNTRAGDVECCQWRTGLRSGGCTVRRGCRSR